MASNDLEMSVQAVINAVRDLSQQLALTAQEQSQDLGRVTKTALDLVSSLRNLALAQEHEQLQECGNKFHECIDHILEVSVYQCFTYNFKSDT